MPIDATVEYRCTPRTWGIPLTIDHHQIDPPDEPCPGSTVMRYAETMRGALGIRGPDSRWRPPAVSPFGPAF